ncbi:MAG TPA: hypothetical protein VLV87_03445 [Gammaproteobacteria bacterium]|nr:hypothetical protein [Gammaproteobacteria bacterium]
MLPRSVPLLACLLAAPGAWADDLYDGASTFLDLGSYNTPFQYPDGSHQADVGRYGVAFSQPLANDFDVELHGGYLTLEVAGEPQPVPQTGSGRYLGLMTRYEGTGQDHLNFSAELSYTWLDVDSSGFGAPRFLPPSQFTWYETWVAAGPVLRYGPLRLSLGAYYQNLDGTETDNDPARVLDFHAGKSFGPYLGVALYVQPDYSIGLIGTAGARKGVRLVFQRDF